MAVFEHPYFSVTATKGSYEISDIPPRQYNLVASHDGYCIITFNQGVRCMMHPHVVDSVIDVKEDDAIEINFEFPVQSVNVET